MTADWRWLAAQAVFIGLATLLCYAVPREAFGWVLLLYTLLFALYALLLRVSDAQTVRRWVWVSLVCRAVLLFSLPNLSDDFYRFLWDGHLTTLGISPFAFTPRSVLATLPTDETLATLFPHLNSPDYFSVYPPVCQIIFFIAAKLSAGNIFAGVVVMKIFVLAFEVGSLVLMAKLLRHFSLPQKSILIYAANPLVIIELSGNLHFEASVVFFLLLAVWLLVQSKATLSALAFALAVCTKLLPLVFLPLLVRRLGLGRTARYGFIVALASAAMFWPFVTMDGLLNITQSLRLYVQTFEFNASVYYIIREIGFYVKGYNIIADAGRGLAAATLAGIGILVALEKKPELKTFFAASLAATGIYYAFATTMHPWYATMLVAFSIFTTWRSAVIWSVVIPLSYAAYSSVPYHENLWLVAAEYIIVLVAVAYDVRRSGVKMMLSDVG
jgi:alpha-1,6-mannosyltransferase